MHFCHGCLPNNDPEDELRLDSHSIHRYRTQEVREKPSFLEYQMPNAPRKDKGGDVMSKQDEFAMKRIVESRGSARLEKGEKGSEKSLSSSQIDYNSSIFIDMKNRQTGI